jgi:hypothetical protein
VAEVEGARAEENSKNEHRSRKRQNKKKAPPNNARAHKSTEGMDRDRSKASL